MNTPKLMDDLRASPRGSERAWDKHGSVAGPEGSGLTIRKYHQTGSYRADVEVVEKSGHKRRLASFTTPYADKVVGVPASFVQAEAWMAGYIAGRASIDVPPLRPQARMKAGKKKPT